MKLIFRFFILVVFLLISTVAFADFIILENGDVIVGEIIADSDYSIVVKTSFGEITIEKNDIADIKKEEIINKGEIVEVFLYDGSRIRGTVIEDTPTKLKIQTELGLVDIDKNNISNVIVGGISDEPNLGIGIDTGTTNLDKAFYDKLSQYSNSAIFVDIFTFRSDRKQDWLIRQGSYILSEVDFLKTIGKTQLAITIEQDIQRRNTFLWIFSVTTATFGVATFIGLYGGFMDGDGNPPNDIDITLMAVGGSLTALSIIGIVIDLPKRHYLGFTEAKSYAEEYNLKLRQELGLTLQDVNLLGNNRKNLDDDSENINDNNEVFSKYNYQPMRIGAGIIPMGLGFNVFMFLNF